MIFSGCNESEKQLNKKENKIEPKTQKEKLKHQNHSLTDSVNIPKNNTLSLFDFKNYKPNISVDKIGSSLRLDSSSIGMGSINDQTWEKWPYLGFNTKPAWLDEKEDKEAKD
jgi:hypothetical protein